jgi:hypothetical protein
VLDLFRGAYRKGEEGRISLLVQNHLRCPVGPISVPSGPRACLSMSLGTH